MLAFSHDLEKKKLPSHRTSILPPHPLFQCCLGHHRICMGKHHDQNNIEQRWGGGQFVHAS